MDSYYMHSLMLQSHNWVTGVALLRQDAGKAQAVTGLGCPQDNQLGADCVVWHTC
jgi:hypothetical protein